VEICNSNLHRPQLLANTNDAITVEKGKGTPKTFEVDVALLLYNDREVVAHILEYFKCKLHRQIATIKGSQIIS
jgi:hypothetical protein